MFQQAFKERLQYAKWNTADILKRVWLYVVLAIGIGGFIHGYVPQDFLVRYAGNGNPFAVPIAVALGVPLYSNAAGVIPIVYALMEKGLEHGHGPCLYDGGDSVVSSRDDNSEKGAEGTPSRCVCRDHDCDYYCCRLFI